MYVRSERERHMAANSGRTETMHRIVPMRFRRFAVGSNSCRRCRTMPLTPYSVSNGSVSRNANGFAFAPHIRKMPTAAATRRISTHRPMPPATFSEMRAVYSLSPASRISVMGESTHRNVASASHGAACFRSPRYRDASSRLTRRRTGCSGSGSAVSCASSSSFNK